MPGFIKILSGGAMRSLMTEVVPLFERAAGIQVEIEFRLTSVLQKDIEDGAAFDIALLPRPELDALMRAGKIAAGTTADITRSSVGLAVKTGARKPDISTVDALKGALLAAGSIAYSDGPSGAYIGTLLQRLGIAEAMKPKIKIAQGGAVAMAMLVKGEVAIGLTFVSEIITEPGVDLVGPLPRAISAPTAFVAFVSAHAADQAAAQALVKFLSSPASVAIYKARGMEPGS